MARRQSRKYLLLAGRAFPALAKAIGIGREDWIDDPVWEVPEALLPRLDRQEREQWRRNPATMQAP